MKRLSFLLVVIVTVVGFSSCSKKDSKNEVAEEVVRTEVAPAAPAKPARLPDPSGTYSDSQGTTSIEFYSSGRYSLTFMGDTGFGKWERLGDYVDIVDENGISYTLQIGDGYVMFNNMRLDK